MTTLSPKQLKDLNLRIQSLTERVASGKDPELARTVVESIEDRVLLEPAPQKGFPAPVLDDEPSK